MSTRRIGMPCGFLLGLASWCVAAGAAPAAEARPNLFLAIADDWGWPHAGCYGDPVVKTPTFDRLAREGVLFANAFVSSPSCTPSRAALLTGQYHWRLEESANLWSTLSAKFRTYPELLREAGCVVGHSRKAWGPGRLEPGGRKENPAGPTFKNFESFLKDRPRDQPFCFWFGSPDPHRPYDWQTGVKSGIRLDQIRLPACFPDHEIIRTDVADYYWEVQRFDREVGEALALLEKTGELDNTLVVMTGDHGMPFPRGKSNLYDLGTHVPLAMRWGKKARGGRTVEDLVSLTDLAPTFLEAAGVKPPDAITGRSLISILTAEQSGRVDPARAQVLYGKERHVPSQEKGNVRGYPCRALRTHDFLYIRNFAPDLWPNGIPDATQAQIGNSFADCDNGPTKSFLISHRDDAAVKRSYDLAFARRPAEELYDLRKDREQLVNVAGRPEYSMEQRELSARLIAALRASQDPRVLGGAEKFDQYPYYGSPQKPDVGGQPASAAKPIADKIKEVAGSAEFLRQVPKHFATLNAFDPVRRQVTLLVEGEKLPKVWPLIPDAEIKVHGWWGRLDQFTLGDRVWIWFKTDRARQPVAVAMIADEISETDIHGAGVPIEAKDAATLTLKTAEKNQPRGRVVQAAKAQVFRGKEKAGLEALKAGDRVYVQTAGDQARLILDVAAFASRQAEQRAALHQRWTVEGLPGTVTFPHTFSGELDYMLDHEALRWGRWLKLGDQVTLQATPPIQAVVKSVRPWRERTELRLVVNSFEQADLTAGQRLRLLMPAPPREVDSAILPTDHDRPRSKEERVEWFLASVYCPCKVRGDGCTGDFYTLASCNPNACGMPNHVRKLVAERIDKGLRDQQIFEELAKEFGPDLLRPHLLP